MSHVVTSPVFITSLDCLKKALAKFPKLQFREGQKKWKWYGRWMNDYDAADAAYKLGIKPEDYGKCEHAIHMDGVEYEIGVMKRTDGKGYSLVWDFYGCGHNINEYIGDAAEKLMTEYNRQFVLQHAATEGLECNTVSETSEQITMELELPTYA